MKKFIVFLVLMLYSNAYSQDDTLLIRLKSGAIGKIALDKIRKIKFENATSVDVLSTMKPDLKNFPNPFSETTTIAFEMETPGTVQISIYDNAGHLVRTLTCGKCSAGLNQLNWDTRNHSGETVPAGVYYYEIRTKTRTMARQMVKIR